MGGERPLWLRVRGLRQIAVIVRRYRTVALAFFGASLLGTLVYTVLQEELYRAYATIELRWNPYGERFPFKDVSEQEFTGYWSFSEFRNTQMQIIRSRQVLQRTIDVLGMVGVSAGQLAAMVQVDPIPESRLIRISVVHDDPRRAADLANTLAQVYVDVGVESRVRWVQQIIDWLRDRIEGTQDDIGRAEHELHEFQKQNNSINLEKDKEQAEREIDELHHRYVEVHTERVALEGRNAEMSAYARHGGVGLDELALAMAASDDQMRELRSLMAQAAAERASLQAVYGPTHPKMMAVDNQLNAYSEQLRRLAAEEIEGTATRLRLARAEEEELKAAIRRSTDLALERSQIWLKYRDLLDQAGGRRQFYDVLLQRFKEVDITRDLNREQAVIIEQAAAPGAPFRPNYQMSIAIGLCLATAGGVGVAFLLNALQQTVQNGEDVEATAGVTPLVELPLIDAASLEYGVERLMQRDPESPLAEAFRVVRNHILFAPQRRGVRVLLFTGAHPLEGKTTVVNNVAISAAQAGRRVLLCDADFRKRSTSRLWNIEDERGFADVLEGRMRWHDVVRESGVPNLTLLGAGGDLARSLELFHKEALERILPGMRQSFDLVLLDGSPLLVVADAHVLAAIADETYIVVEAGRVHKREIREIKSVLDRIGQTRYDFILNKVTVPSGGFAAHEYPYGYGYGYHAPRPETPASDQPGDVVIKA